MIIKILILVCCMIALFIIFRYYDPEAAPLKDGEEGRVDLNLNEGNDKRTRVVPTPDFELSTNTVYCASFQLAWQALKETVAEDIILSGQPEMADRMNESAFSRNPVDEKDYYVNFGFGREDIITKINNDLVDRFGSGAPDKISLILRPEDMIVYAYIYKNLEFQYAFDKLEQPICFQTQEGITDVKGYGIKSYRPYRHQHFKDQVEILYYNSQEDFAIGLNSNDDNDEYLLARIKPGSTLKETYIALSDKIANGKKDSLRERDSLMIPNINIDITRQYNEIVNRPFLNDRMRGFYISQALQNIKFSAGEKGAVVSSEAKLIFSRETLWNSRQMIFDGPFMVVLKRKGIYDPYLMIWIHDAELLEKSQSK